MIWIGNDIDKDYAWELSALHQFRQLNDGLSFFEFNINWDRYLADHSPKFEIILVICNFTIVEFNIYYLWHRDKDIQL